MVEKFVDLVIIYIQNLINRGRPKNQSCHGMSSLPHRRRCFQRSLPHVSDLYAPWPTPPLPLPPQFLMANPPLSQSRSLPKRKWHWSKLPSLPPPPYLLFNSIGITGLLLSCPSGAYLLAPPRGLLISRTRVGLLDRIAPRRIRRTK